MKNALYLTKVLFLNSFGVNFKKKDTKGLSRLGFIGILLTLVIFVGAPMVIMGYSFGVVFCHVPERVKVSPDGYLTDICLDISSKGHKQRILEADW